MGAMASQITSVSIVGSTVGSVADQRKYQSSASLAFVRGIHRWSVNSPHKGPVTRKMSPFDDVIMPSGVCSSSLALVHDGATSHDFAARQPSHRLRAFRHHRGWVGDKSREICTRFLLCSFFVVFLSVMLWFLANSGFPFCYICQNFSTGTGVIVWFPQCLWTPEGCGYWKPIEKSHKLNNALVPYPTIHHSKQKCAHCGIRDFGKLMSDTNKTHQMGIIVINT